MSIVTISLTDEQLARLKQVADRLGVGVEETALRGVEEFVKRQQLEEVADYLLVKNEELYRRLV